MSMNWGRRAPSRKRYGKAPYWRRFAALALLELRIGVGVVDTPCWLRKQRGKITPVSRARKEIYERASGTERRRRRRVAKLTQLRASQARV
jgi:hypothetical protein